MIRSIPLTLSDGTVLISNYFNYKEAEDEIVTNNNEYQERVNLIYTPKVVGNYLIEWYIEVCCATVQAKSAGIKVIHNEVILAETIIDKVEGAMAFSSISGGKVVNVNDSEQTFALYFNSPDSQEVRVRRARIFLSKI